MPQLSEEVGELFRAVRKLQGLPQDPGGRIADVSDEAADTLILLILLISIAKPATTAGPTSAKDALTSPAPSRTPD